MIRKKNELLLARKVQEISRNYEGQIDIRQILLYLITSVSRNIGVENVLFLLHNINSEEFELKESIKFKKRFLSFSKNEAFIQYFFNKREPLVLKSLQLAYDKLKKKSDAKEAKLNLFSNLIASLEEIQTEIAVPFYIENECIGILCVGKKINKPFSTDDLFFLEEMAVEFSQKIYFAMRYEEATTKEKEITSLYEVGKVISSLFDFNKTFDIIVRNASIILKAPKIIVLLRDDVDSVFNIKKEFGFTEFQLARIDETPKFRECLQMSHDVAEGILVKNYEDNVFFPQPFLQDLGVYSLLSVPLFDDDLNIIGELRAMRPITQVCFTRRDLGIASSLANNIVLALNNSKRYQKSEEHLIELSTVYNVIKTLTSEFELERIMDRICSIFTEELNFSRSILYIYEDNRYLVAKAASRLDGVDLSTLKLDISRTVEGKALIEGRIIQMGAQDVDEYNHASITDIGMMNFVAIPLLLSSKKAIGVLVIDIGQDSAKQTNIRLLTAIANQSAVILENARLYKKSEELNKQLRIEQSRTAKELQMARYIQQGMLSADLPKTEAVKIAAKNIPCRSVGGDFYNFIQRTDNKLGIVIGDVSGKGIPAALLMTMTNSIFTEYGQRYLSTEEVLNHTNSALQHYLSKSPIFYVTAFYGVLDIEKNIIRYCKAGHNPPILYKQDTNEVVFLDGEGTYLGTFDEGGYIEKNVAVSKGDKLVMYTDGITEVRNEEKKLFSKERLAKLIKEHHTLPVDKLLKILIREAEIYGGSTEFADDITLVIIDFDKLDPVEEKIIYKVDYKIKSSMEDVKAVISEFLKKLQKLEINKRLFNHIRLALSEALMNAFEHGNKKNKDKYVYLKGKVTDMKIELSVIDEGEGFDMSRLKFFENQQEINNRGRGIMAMMACMDDVKFNEKGNILTFTKYII
ncbi:MAG: SpoIIE family protein phosphatase [Candidatus Margulisbacteria bacterium]|nr:SpoIIE family protein phosphatase [Candidatus Margulisiibacteriota bacterium]